VIFFSRAKAVMEVSRGTVLYEFPFCSGPVSSLVFFWLSMVLL
jgi:hypothetical protein